MNFAVYFLHLFHLGALAICIYITLQNMLVCINIALATHMYGRRTMLSGQKIHQNKVQQKKCSSLLNYNEFFLIMKFLLMSI